MEVGQDYNYTVSRSGVSTAGPLSVAIASSNGAIIVGRTITIPAGQTIASGTMRALTPGVTTLTATAAGVQSSSRTATVIQPLARVQSVSISPTSPVQGEMVTVTLTRGGGRIDEGISHAIFQSAVERQTFSVPESVNIPAGQTTASFTAQALAVGNAAIEVYITGSPSEGGATLQYGFAIREAGDRQTTYTTRGLILRETGELSTKSAQSHADHRRRQPIADDHDRRTSTICLRRFDNRPGQPVAGLTTSDHRAGHTVRTEDHPCSPALTRSISSATMSTRMARLNPIGSRY